MGNVIVVNESVVLNDSTVEIMGANGKSRVPLPVLCNLSEYSARMTVHYLGGTLSGPEYVSMLKYNKEWRNG